MANEPEIPPDTPAWMLALEKKRQRVHRLAHEIGAGSPCLLCKDDCPGLDLHFWRKLCRNCKCKKEDHDVVDDCGCEQFEILLGSSHSKNRPKRAFLEMLEQQTNAAIPAKRVAFDWVPPDAPPTLAAEYMQALPASKLPISGSDGALYRRQQLERQLPLHDLDSNQCHQLSDTEVENFKKYLDNLRSNVVGQGRIAKLSIPISHSADSLKNMATYNSVPKPFHLNAGSPVPVHNAHDLPLTPIRDLPPPFHGLKPPSAFWPKGRISPRGISPEPSFTSNESHGSDVAYSSVADQGALFGVTLSPSSERAQYQDGVLEKSGISYKGLASSVPAKSEVGHSEVLKLNSEMALTKSASPQGDKTQASSVPGHCMLKDGEIGSNQDQEQVPGCKHLSSPYNSQQDPVESELVCHQHPHFESETRSVPGNMWVPVDCSECSKRAQNGQLVHDHICSSVEKSTLISPSLVAGLMMPSKKLARASNDFLSNTLGTQAIPNEELNQAPYPSSQVCVSDKQVEPGTLCAQPSQSISSDGIQTPVGVSQYVCSSEDVITAKPNQSSNLPESRSRGLSPVSNKQLTARSRDASPALSGGLNSPLATKLGVGGNLNHPMPMEGLKAIDSRGSANSISSLSGTPHMAALYAHNALHSPSALEPQDTMSPHIASLTLEEAVEPSALGLESSEWPSKEPCAPQMDLHCTQCREDIFPGEVVVCADRAGPGVVWHPKCFVCSTCKELLVDLVYFFSKGQVFCGRHFAELLNIPRCCACDELIFVKEHTVAEGQVFHVKHFCCFECDEPLGGKQYVPKDGQPVCLPCYGRKYGKSCQTCNTIIDAKVQGVAWKELHWHATPDCFRCCQCHKSLLGGRFAVREQQPFCSKECIQEALNCSQ